MTTKLILTNTPVQVSNGTKQVYLTVTRGQGLRYASGATIPDKSSFHELNSYAMNIGEGFSMWVWNESSNPVEIAYTEAT